MNFEIVGKLIVKYDVVQRSETFKTREFVIEKSEDANGRTFTSYIKFQCVQDKTAMVDKFNIGEEVKVQFNIRGTKWVKDGRENYITNLDAWRMESILPVSNQPVNVSPVYPDQVFESSSSDDLPFQNTLLEYNILSVEF